MTYSEKLKDPRWQRKRLEIMERDNFQCRFCDDNEKTLNVHHGYYEKGLDPWEYKENTLYTICIECHEWVQNILRDCHYETAQIEPQFLAEAFDIIKELKKFNPYDLQQIYYLIEIYRTSDIRNGSNK